MSFMVLIVGKEKNSWGHTGSLFCIEKRTERISWIATSEGVAASDRLTAQNAGHIREAETVTLLTISAL
jgi:hypothetical protein